MMKAEMTLAQIDNRNLFTNKLISAGWNLDQGIELLFEQGHSTVPEARAKYQNAAFYLRINYIIEGGYVLWECLGKDNPITMTIRFYPKQNLDSILASIFAVQDTLSPDNCGDFVLTMIPLCTLVLIETREGLIQVSLPA